jgi:hypothetical protein
MVTIPSVDLMEHRPMALNVVYHPRLPTEHLCEQRHERAVVVHCLPERVALLRQHELEGHRSGPTRILLAVFIQ